MLRNYWSKTVLLSSSSKATEPWIDTSFAVFYLLISWRLCSASTTSLPQSLRWQLLISELWVPFPLGCQLPWFLKFFFFYHIPVACVCLLIFKLQRWQLWSNRLCCQGTPFYIFVKISTRSKYPNKILFLFSMAWSGLRRRKLIYLKTYVIWNGNKTNYWMEVVGKRAGLKSLWSIEPP